MQDASPIGAAPLLRSKDFTQILQIRSLVNILLFCRHKTRLGSCVSISGPLLGNPWSSEEMCSQEAAAKREGSQGTPILITYGSKDDVVPSSKMKHSKRQLSKHGNYI